jgi:rare lipoprotein A
MKRKGICLCLSLSVFLSLHPVPLAADQAPQGSSSQVVAFSEPAWAQHGIASWYGPGFHGRRTANGEIFNQYALTAGHRTLPLGAWVAVKNLKNGKSVAVRINDRGPYIKKRVIDLSYSAGRFLDIIKPGKAPVEVKVLRLP